MTRLGDALEALLKLQDDEQRKLIVELNQLRARAGGRSNIPVSGFTGISGSQAAVDLIRDLNELGGRDDKQQSFFQPGLATIKNEAINFPLLRIYPIDGKALAAVTASITVPVPTDTQHLMIVGNGRTTTTGSAAENILVRGNGDTGANYDTETIYRLNNTSSGGQNLANTAIAIGTFATADADANASGNCFAVLPNILSTFFKGVTAIGGGYFTAAAGAIVFTDFGQWESTNKITSLTLLPEAGSFAAGTNISVYRLL